MKIVIIWWTSGFGKWLAKYIKNHFSVNVVVTWTNKEKWKNVSKELDVEFTIDNISAVTDADIVIFSVPISKMESIIKHVAPYINPQAVVADVCSIKCFVADAFKKYAPASCVIIPTHPMFWPYVSSIAEQTFVLTADEKTQQTKAYKWLKNYLGKNEAKVIETTPEKHDKMMWIVQGLTHVNMFTIWETIRKLWVPVEETLKFVSPIYKLLITSVARYIWHDPRLYGDIQMYNPEVLKVHKKFMEVINDFNKAVENKDEDKFINIIQQTNDFFWHKNCDFWQKYTDKLIYFVAKQREKVQNWIWKKLIFKNIYTNKTIFKTVKAVNDDEILLENWEKIDLNEWLII